MKSACDIAYVTIYEGWKISNIYSLLFHSNQGVRTQEEAHTVGAIPREEQLLALKTSIVGSEYIDTLENAHPNEMIFENKK